MLPLLLAASRVYAVGQAVSAARAPVGQSLNSLAAFIKPNEPESIFGGLRNSVGAAASYVGLTSLGVAITTDDSKLSRLSDGLSKLGAFITPKEKESTSSNAREQNTEKAEAPEAPVSAQAETMAADYLDDDSNTMSM